VYLQKFEGCNVKKKKHKVSEKEKEGRREVNSENGTLICLLWIVVL